MLIKVFSIENLTKLLIYKQIRHVINKKKEIGILFVSHEIMN